VKEIPQPLIKANQIGMVLLVVLSYLPLDYGFRSHLFVYAAFLIQLISLFAGPQWNPFMWIARLALGRERLQRAEKQAAELARFNQTIAVSLLGLASVFHAFGLSAAGHVFAGMVALAAFVAVLGYCIGCTIYYQYKKWKLLRARSS
jgi:hypothetical protein